MYSQNIIKLLYDFQNVLIQVTQKEEPSILSRYLIELAKSYSTFYNENKILCEEKELQEEIQKYANEARSTRRKMRI